MMADHPLSPHELGLTLRITIRDPDGRIEQRFEQPGRSFLEQMVRFYRNMARSSIENIVDINGVSRAVNTGIVPYMRAGLGGVGDATEGIVVGSDATAVAITNRALGTLIANGAGAGQLNYLAMNFGAFAVAAPDAQVLSTRAFLNASTGTVTIRETGVYVQANIAGPSPFDFCIIRDVLVTEAEVEAQRSISVDYLIKAST